MALLNEPSIGDLMNRLNLLVQAHGWSHVVWGVNSDGLPDLFCCRNKSTVVPCRFDYFLEQVAKERSILSQYRDAAVNIHAIEE